MATTPVPDKQLRELPPSAKLVFFVLKHHESLTQQQISDESLLPSRTVRYALSELQDEDLITNQVSLRDARQQVYSLSDAGEATARSSFC
jgi:DNA-binding MarR family transcriptional regulator